MTTTEWITDRRPTEADTFGDGYVRMCISPGSEDWTVVHWSYVGAGIPWRHPSSWQPKPALAVGQRWRRKDGKVVTIDKIDRNHCYGQTHPFWAGTISYTPGGSWMPSGPHLYDLVELLPPSPIERVVKQLKELQDRIQTILDSLPPN